MDGSNEQRAFNQTKTFLAHISYIFIVSCGYLVLSVIFRIYGIDFHPKRKIIR